MEHFHENAPNQTELTYRLRGFMERMVAQLPQQRVSDDDGVLRQPLRALSTRATDDPAIALMDAWATVAKVLSFYTERIANEGYLMTAQERRSVLELARMIGYELNPGIAASALLVFTVDMATANLGTVHIPAKTPVQSLPHSGGLPQTFETLDDFTAYADWNAIPARHSRLQRLAIHNNALVYFDTENSIGASGVTKVTNLSTLYMVHGNHPTEAVYVHPVNTLRFAQRLDTLRAGDRLLLVGKNSAGSQSHLWLSVKEVEIFPVKEETLVTTTLPASSAIPFVPDISYIPILETIPTLDLTLDTVQEHVTGELIREQDLAAIRAHNNWSRESLKTLSTQLIEVTEAADRGVYIFQQVVGCFGVNSPSWQRDENNRILQNLALDKVTTGEGTPAATGSPNWDASGGWSIWKTYPNNEVYSTKNDFDIALEREVDGIANDSWAVITRGSHTLPLQVASTTKTSVTGFGISGKATGLDLKGSYSKDNNYTIRNTRVYVQSEQLSLADTPIDVVVGGTSVMLDSLILDLHIGQAVILEGERNDAPDVSHTETLFVSEITHRYGFTILSFIKPMAYEYKRDTVTIYANAVPSTHGESQAEVLGSGGKKNLRFKLNRNFLTYISSDSESGAESTLTVRVNNVEWTQYPNLLAAGANDKAYAVYHDEFGQASIIFGDGKHGAIPPTGQENITAMYRQGIGVVGHVPVDTLTLLARRPAGIRDVTNPLASSGGSDPEALDDARQNAPIYVKTIGNIVSLQDYEDYARAFAGIGKAKVTLLSRGTRQLAHITIMASDGSTITDDMPVYQNLVSAITRAHNPDHLFAVAGYTPIPFNITATIVIDKRYLPDVIHAQAMALLEATFYWKNRDLAQDVTAAEIMTILHQIEGVIYVDVDGLDTSAQVFNAALKAHPARWDNLQKNILPAQMLLLNSAGVKLTVTVAS